MEDTPMRQFIRHPADIPIEVARTDHATPEALHALNVSVGGLAFQSVVSHEPGTIVDLRIPIVRPEFETKARVVWCTRYGSGFELGVEFLEAEDAFRARMVEQVCHIEDYKKEVHRTEGRTLTSEQAAQEWIGKYAAQFPNPGRNDTH
jgi:hypothetical protein